MKRRVLTLVPAVIVALAGAAWGQQDQQQSGKNGARAIVLPSGGVLHQAAGAVRGQRVISVPGSATKVAVWEEADDAGRFTERYAVSLDGVSLSGRVRENSKTIELQYASFDPLAGLPRVEDRFSAKAGNEVHLVQFVVWPLPEFRAGLEALGAKVVKYLPENTLAVRMSAATAQQVRALPHVRWVGAHHPAYRIDPKVMAEVVAGRNAGEPVRYTIECFERGMADQSKVADAIIALGGVVDVHTPDQFRMEASLTHEQMLAVAAMNEVNWVEPWGGPAQYDMNNIRTIGGANYIETQLGFTGQGVRGEVFDSELRSTHTEFALVTPVAHSPTFDPGDVSHGSSSYSCVFASGVSALARGMLPNAGEGYFYNDGASTQFGGAQSRLAANQQLVNPLLAYQCVFQTSSVGSARTTTYTAISAEVDDYLFLTQLLSTQSQSNAGWFAEANNNSRPQAWAKNIVSVGAVYGFNNANTADDRWISAAASCNSPSGNVSSGPASDGRIKPDLCFYNDCVRAAEKSSDVAYTEFGGTSSATPMTAGHFGVFFQMWHEGVWKGRGGKSSVFASRAKMTTAKAALINTASQYNWPAGGANGDITRVRQGWGRPNLQTLYDRRDVTFIVDEEDVLSPLGSRVYTVLVPPGQPSLNVTMCYVDPQGNPAVQATHRVNDLSLRVIAPSGTVYWGNNGLSAALASSSGGVSNTKDTVENVIVNAPAAGVWTIEVHGDVITQDSHTETAAVDADFSIWATGCTEFNFKKAPVYGYSIQSNLNDHLYRINMHTGEAVDLGLVGNGDLEGLSFGPNGNLYGITGSAAAATGQLWDVSFPPGFQVGASIARNGIDAGFDYFNGTLYNIQGGGAASDLYRVNASNGVPTLIGSSATYLDNLAIDTLGNGYGASLGGGGNTLHSVNITNGATALIGPLGVAIPQQAGSSFSADNTLYMITGDGKIYTIDTGSGAATFRCNVTVSGVVTAGWEGLAIDKLTAVAPMALPGFASTFSGVSATRGYVFTAPYNGAIQGLRVPNEANETIQNVEIVRFNAMPPAFPAVSNNFVSLGRFENQPADQVIPCNIPVAEGDIIGVLGACGTTTMRNSYGSPAGTFVSSMKGQSTTLTRLVMQDNLNETGAADLSTEAAGQIARVELYYTDGRRNMFLSGDQPVAGGSLPTSPLVNSLGTTVMANGELLANGGGDGEFIAAGAQGFCLDGLGSPASSELLFGFDVDAVSFIYAGNSGGFTAEAYNSANVLVDSFSAADTFNGFEAGPRTLSGVGIRRLRWFESVGGQFAAIDNVRVHATVGWCYANCDGSTGNPLLTANDFTCFVNAYATNNPYANCDGSTGTPLLTGNDFTCFINRYALGCP